MKKLFIVITDCGDGSNSLSYTFDEELIEKMYDRQDELDDQYQSGDGLQVSKLNVPDDFTYATLGISQYAVQLDPFGDE